MTKSRDGADSVLVGAPQVERRMGGGDPKGERGTKAPPSRENRQDPHKSTRGPAGRGAKPDQNRVKKRPRPLRCRLVLAGLVVEISCITPWSGLGSIWDRFGIDLGISLGSGSVWGQFGIDLGSVRGPFGRNLGVFPETRKELRCTIAQGCQLLGVAKYRASMYRVEHDPSGMIPEPP